MPKIKLKLFANLRELTKTKELEINGNTIKEVLEIICKNFNGLNNVIFKDNSLNPYINVFLNGINIKDTNNLETQLKEGDEIAIFPPVSGG